MSSEEIIIVEEEFERKDTELDVSEVNPNNNNNNNRIENRKRDHSFYCLSSFQGKESKEEKIWEI